MLKPSDPAMRPVDPAEERPVGELVHQLVEDGKSYARAELGVAKATAAAKANAVKLPAILFGGALLFLQGAINVLAVGVCLALAPLIGPLLAGLIAFLIFAASAGGMAWFGIKKLREDL